MNTPEMHFEKTFSEMVKGQSLINKKSLEIFDKNTTTFKNMTQKQTQHD